MMRRVNIHIIVIIAALLLPFMASGQAWECSDSRVDFDHKPSDYYGSGAYLTKCPQNGARIRCYHYHRHWVCKKKEFYYWDRNLESAARTACECSLPQDVTPSSAAVSKEPFTRFHDGLTP